MIQVKSATPPPALYNAVTSRSRLRGGVALARKTSPRVSIQERVAESSCQWPSRAPLPHWQKASDKVVLDSALLARLSSQCHPAELTGVHPYP